MTTTAEILINKCDAAFRGEDALSATIPFGESETLELLYHDKPRIIVSDYGEKGGGAVRLPLETGSFSGVRFLGDGLSDIATHFGQEGTAEVLAQIKVGGEITLQLTPRSRLFEPAFIKIKHSVDI